MESLTTATANKAASIRDSMGLPASRLTVTTEPAEAGRALAARRPVLIVQPPQIEFETWSIYDLSWELLLISSKTASTKEATEQMAPIIAAMAEGPEYFDRATPWTYEFNGNTYPAYQITQK